MTGSAISIVNQTAAVTIGLGNASSGTLNLDLAELANLNTSGTVTIGSATAGALSTTSINLPSNGNSFALSLQGDSIAIGGLVMDTGDRLTLNAVSNGISQSGGIFTDALLLGGVGFMNLTNTSNQIRRVAGSATGNVRITNDATTVMVVDTVGASSSLAVTSGLTRLLAPAGITINVPITSPGGGAQFTTDAIAINAAVSAPSITIDNSTSGVSVGVGSGAGSLSVSAAELALLNTTGTVVIGSSSAGVVTTSAIDLPTLGRSFPLTLTGASISTGGIIMDTGDELTLSAASGGVSQSGAISATNLTLTGGGTFLLNSVLNVIGSVQGSVTGAITIVNSGALSVGGPLASNGFNISLNATSLTVGNSISAGAGDVSLTTDSIAITAAVSGTNIQIANRSAVTTIGLGGAAGTLNISDAEFASLAPSASGTVTIGSSTAGAMEVQSLVTSTGADLSLIAASINTIGGLNVGSGSNLRLEGVSGGVSQDEAGAGLIADTVTLAGAGSFSLDNTTNDIATLDGTVNGSILYIDFNGLAIGASGLASTGNDITIIAPTSLTVNGTVNAGAGELTLLANTMDIAADVTGQAGISLAPVSDGISIGLAGASGTFNLTTTELGHLISSSMVTIGRGGPDAGSLDAGDIDSTITGFNRDYSLTLLGGDLLLNSISLKTGKNLILTAAAGNIAANQINAPGGLTATATNGASRGIFTVNSGVTTSAANIAIDADLNVGGSNVTLTSGNGDINVTGFIVTGSDNTNQ
ncbi:MAG: hypothetical protein NTV94_03260, partial [Planctomycetota bacterium]|nr:hypothetical protein [Planctomycetota bacterium]